MFGVFRKCYFENIRVAFVDIFIEHLAIAEQGEILAMERGIAGRVQEAERWWRLG